MWKHPSRRIVGATLLSLSSEESLGRTRSVAAAVKAQMALAHLTLAMGVAAPDFDLPGVDGKNHTLAEYKKYPILVLIFTCNHCPTAQLYEGRIQSLVDAYALKGG